jgi:hypothetical protein
MSYPILPRVVPACALRDDWSLSPVDPLRRTELDDGNFAVERRLHRLPGRQTLSWRMTGPQFDVLVAFWKRDLDGGVAWFQCPIVEGSRTELRLVRFSASPPWTGTSPANGIFRFSFEAELREIPHLNDDELMATIVSIDAATPAELDGLIQQLTTVVDDLEGLILWS